MATAPAHIPQYDVEEGSPHPLGATIQPNAVNFSLYSGGATGVELLLFDAHDSQQPLQTLQSVTSKNKTFHFWHIFVKDLKTGTHYAFRVTGPSNPEAGLRYNHNKVLIDPYARGNTKTLWKRVNACNGSDNVATSLRSVIIDPEDYDWEGDKPINRPIEDTIVYELHVRGFTALMQAQRDLVELRLSDGRNLDKPALFPSGRVMLQRPVEFALPTRREDHRS
jgi:isoamylase